MELKYEKEHRKKWELWVWLFMDLYTNLVCVLRELEANYGVKRGLALRGDVCRLVRMLLWGMERSDDRLFWSAIGRDKENRKYEIYFGGKFSIQIDARKPGTTGNTCHPHPNNSICQRCFTVLGPVYLQNKCCFLVQVQNV